jgi:hypothetical protein
MGHERDNYYDNNNDYYTALQHSTLKRGTPARP